MKYDALFTPFKIGNMEVKNRFVMAPMGTNSSHIDDVLLMMKLIILKRELKVGLD